MKQTYNITCFIGNWGASHLSSALRVKWNEKMKDKPDYHKSFTQNTNIDHNPQLSKCVHHQAFCDTQHYCNVQTGSNLHYALLWTRTVRVGDNTW